MLPIYTNHQNSATHYSEVGTQSSNFLNRRWRLGSKSRLAISISIVATIIFGAYSLGKFALDQKNPGDSCNTLGEHIRAVIMGLALSGVGVVALAAIIGSVYLINSCLEEYDN